MILCYFFFNDTATTEIYTLSLHDALPIYLHHQLGLSLRAAGDLPGAIDAFRTALRFDPLAAETHGCLGNALKAAGQIDRKSTRLNSSHANISYAVFCLKKKKK